MRTVLLTLKDAVETGLKDIELLDKQDKVIFLYPKGKDNISIQVHTALSQLKCKVEFYEIPDENVSDQDMAIYFAYLTGSNPNTVIVDTGAVLVKLSYLNIPRYPDFRSLFGKKDSVQPKENRTRKTKNTAATELVKESVTKMPAKRKASSTVQAEQLSLPIEESKRVKKPSAKQDATADMDSLKTFLQANANERINPATLTMGIYEAVSNSIINKTLISEELKKVIIIDCKIDALNDALQGKWGKVTDMVSDILKAKGKI